MKSKIRDLLNLVAQSIYNKKGSNILAIDIRKISSMTDYVVIAEGRIDRHVMAIAREIEESLGDIGVKPVHVDGRKNGDWIVLDYLNVMIHLFMPGMREKYQLEKLWHEGEICDLNISIDEEAANQAAKGMV